MNADTPSECMTIAVPTVVGGVLKLATMPPMEMGSAAMLNEINAWPRRDDDHRQPRIPRG